jgi:cytidylate kinase
MRRKRMKGKEERRLRIVTIDGPAGSGKSTVARAVAARTGLRYLDTGLLYRAIALFLSRKGIPPTEKDSLRTALEDLQLTLEGDRVRIGAEDVSEALRKPEIDRIVSLYAALPSVRKRLLHLQQSQAVLPGLVADGRDMGSVVFPEAGLKIFLTAGAEERARRRFLEQSSKGEKVLFEQVLSDVLSRDETDSTREIAPLSVPKNAIVVDTTEKTVEQVVKEILRLIDRTFGENDSGVAGGAL